MSTASNVAPISRAASVGLGVLLVICCLIPTAQAQYRFDSWTADTGLPQNIIRAVHQTRDGYLWVATLDGLARFDGVRFTVFDKSNTAGIDSNRFFSPLHDDRQGDLWLGTENGYVTRYGRGRFTTYTTAHGLPQSVVAGFTEDVDGNLYCLSGQRLWRWQPNPGSESTEGRFNEVATPPLLAGLYLMGWKGRGFWGVDQTGLHCFVDGRWEFHLLPAAFRQQDLTVAEEPDGTLWVATPDGRLAQLKDEGTVKLFRAPPGGQGDREPVWQVNWPGRQGKAWTLGVDRGLNLSLTLPSSDRLERVAFNIFFEDRDGNLWLGTDGQGLYRVRKQVITVYSQPQGLAGRNVYPIYEDHAGAVWIGTWDGGLSRFHAGRFTNFTRREGLQADRIMALYEDRAGQLWIGTSMGLSLLRDGGFIPVSERIISSGVEVNVIFEDRAGALWFGTIPGLVRYKDGKATLLGAKDGLASDNVRVIIEAAAGGLWFGGYGGLTRFEDGKFTTWTERDGLPGNMVRSLYEDRDGVLWIGTYDSGLGRFKDGRFTRYTTREGLFNNGAFQILEDTRGHLWMSSNRGIYRVRKEELNEFAEGKRGTITSIAYGKSDGMFNVECNGGLWPAGVRTRDGKLWFPTQDGVAVIDPETITPNPQPPPVLIESFLLDRVAVDFDRRVQIQPGQENFEIQYTALSLINSENIRFKYQLEGLDHGWIDAGTRRTAYYSHVPDGEYTFKVIAANSDGAWNTEGKSLKVVVLPPFYRTWWFLALAVLGVAGVVLLGYEYRIRQFQRAQAVQQAFSRQLIASQEGERKRIAAELHDSLGQRLVVVKSLALMFLNGPANHGEAREQVEQISAEASQAIGEVKEISYNLRPYQLDRIGLTKAVEAIVKTAAAASGIAFSAEIDEIDEVFPEEYEINFYRIVQESVNNIVKHSAATEAAVTIRRDEDRLLLTIRDNGRGFTPGAVNHDSRGGGFGLIGISERAQLLGGKPVIQSAPAQGTTISIEIDLEDVGHDRRNPHRDRG